jgi:hypothetical protein
MDYYGNQVLAWDRHKNEVALNQVMEPNCSLLIIRALLNPSS